MSTTSPIPYFLLSAWFLGVGALVLRCSPYYLRLIIREEGQQRFHALDGLRGFLALAVFIHHSVIAFGFFATGRGGLSPSRFYNLLGPIGVAFFFMLTALLFWTRGTRPGSQLRIGEFLWGRVARIAPMYFASVAAAVFVVFSLSKFELMQPAWAFFRQLLVWSAFGIRSAGDLNAVAGSLSMVGVHWTLMYEWLFYIFLPVALIFSRGWHFAGLLVVCAFATVRYSRHPVEWNFLARIVTAAALPFSRRLPLRVWNHWVVSLAALIGLACPLMFARDDKYGLILTAPLFLCLILFANGNTVFGLLTSRPARLLGMISYSVYLLHAVVLFGALSLFDSLMPIRLIAPLPYWLLVATLGTFLITLCALSFRYVEQPGMTIPRPSSWGLPWSRRRPVS